MAQYYIIKVSEYCIIYSIVGGGRGDQRTCHKFDLPNEPTTDYRVIKCSMNGVIFGRSQHLYTKRRLQAHHCAPLRSNRILSLYKFVVANFTSATKIRNCMEVNNKTPQQ